MSGGRLGGLGGLGPAASGGGSAPAVPPPQPSQGQGCFLLHGLPGLSAVEEEEVQRGRGQAQVEVGT